MSAQPFFAGLVYDEDERVLDTALVGGEAYYVVDDAGFRRHVEAGIIDRPVLQQFIAQLQEHKDIAVLQALQLLGQDDLFTKAAVDAQIDSIDVDMVLAQGFPLQAREMMGMMGFRIIVNVHGEIVRFDFPSISEEDDPEG